MARSSMTLTLGNMGTFLKHDYLEARFCEFEGAHTACGSGSDDAEFWCQLDVSCLSMAFNDLIGHSDFSSAYFFFNGVGRP